MSSCHLLVCRETLDYPEGSCGVTSQLGSCSVCCFSVVIMSSHLSAVQTEPVFLLIKTKYLEYDICTLHVRSAMTPCTVGGMLSREVRPQLHQDIWNYRQRTFTRLERVYHTGMCTIVMETLCLRDEHDNMSRENTEMEKSSMRDKMFGTLS